MIDDKNRRNRRLRYNKKFEKDKEEKSPTRGEERRKPRKRMRMQGGTAESYYDFLDDDENDVDYEN